MFDKNGLITAASVGDLEQVKFIFKTQILNSYHASHALRAAVVCGHLHVVEYFLQFEICNDFSRENALLTAARYKHLEIVQFLINSKKINIRSTLINVTDLETLKVFSSLGVDLRMHHDLAFVRAAENGKLDILVYLLSEAGADIHARNEQAL